MKFGPQLCGDLDTAAQREWLVADGLGGFAMGTVPGLRTRRYHGLLVVATRPPGGRMLGLAALDPTLVIGDARFRLAVHEWAGGSVDPNGSVRLESFELRDGLPSWRWRIGEACLERTLAMAPGSPAVAVVHRLLPGSPPVRLELDALCTWRDVHGERFGDAAPALELVQGGFVFDGSYRVRGPDFRPAGEWYRGVWYRVEAERGLSAREDLWHAGTFGADLEGGEVLEVSAWAGDLSVEPMPPTTVVSVARRRSAAIARAAGARTETDKLLAMAADQFVVAGPTVIAGYPWFGDWSRDTMTSYEGLFLETGRAAEGSRLLERMAGTLSEGMLANTADVGGTEYNTADATLWFLHAVARHVDRTAEIDLTARLLPALRQVVDWHLKGTRYGIAVDTRDGLLKERAEGYALTWMDARVDGRPVTQRLGKAVEINALWINGLAGVAGLAESLGQDASDLRRHEERARAGFRVRFRQPGGYLDVADPDDGGLRPNCLLAVSLPHAPLDDRDLVERCSRSLLTPLGLRSLAPQDPAYIGHHRGGPAERDAAYHQGTVWPWLIGPYVEAAIKTGSDVNGVLDGLEAHLEEWGLGSVSETADGDPPHRATGCPFQAWSVAELLRARRLSAK